MDIKKVLQDYISYHWIEEFITDEQKDAMLKNLGVYIKGMQPQLIIHSVGSAFYCKRDIEGKSICDAQCEHCEEYYKPLKQ